MIAMISQVLGAGGVIRSPSLRSFLIQKAAFPLDIQFHTEDGRFLGSAQSVPQGTFHYNGLDSHGRAYPPVILTISTVNAQAVEIITSMGEVGARETTITGLTVVTEKSGGVSTLPDIQIVGGAGGMQGLIFGGAPDTLHVHISNLSLVDCRIGDINTGAARGARLQGGTDIIIDTAGALYAFVPALETVDFAVTIHKV
jgi:hypothetical protein